MADYSELKKLAEAFPDYEWDSNTEPFFNGPSGESLGGGSTGFYCVYGPEFEIDGESYEGVTLVESCPADQAKFICKAKAGILALIAENEALKGLYRMHQQTETREMRDLKAEIAGLKTGYEAFEQVNAGLKAEVASSTEREIMQLAEIESLRKDLVDWQEVLAAVKREVPERFTSHARGNAPGHSHSISGVWDDDNGVLAGKECAWCKAWSAAMGNGERP